MIAIFFVVGFMWWAEQPVCDIPTAYWQPECRRIVEDRAGERAL